jgi:hypothetical protein
VSFAAITFCVASQQVIPKVSVYFVIDSVRTVNGLKQGAALSLFLLKFTLEYTNQKALESLEGLELNEIHRLLVCAVADGVHLLGENLNTVKNNTVALLKASKEVCLEVHVNAEKMKYSFMSSSPECRATSYFKGG